MRRFFAVVIWLSLTVAYSGWCGTLAQFRTRFGNIDVELYDQDKPITVRNFIRYVQGGSYTNMIAHRGIANFVIQGGGFYVANRGTTNVAFASIPVYAPITNEFGVGKFYSNVYGTIAMAKTSDPNSATSQFFFNLTNNASSLDVVTNSGGFTVFGHVVGGTNVLNKLNAGAVPPSISIGNAGAPFDNLPFDANVLPQNVTYEDLIYIDVSLVNVQVTNLNNTARISWNSVSNQTNFVEYTTNFPPVWKTLTSFVANGSATNVVDPAAASTNRFYRVRVVY